MSLNMINLAVRFALEIGALVAMGSWGWAQSSSWTRYPLAIGVPLLAAVLWGTFAVPDDPSRSGRAPVPVSGMVRLGLELIFFGFATWSLYRLGAKQLSVVFGGIAAAHHLLSYDRISWLLKKKD